MDFERTEVLVRVEGCCEKDFGLDMDQDAFTVCRTLCLTRVRHYHNQTSCFGYVRGLCSCINLFHSTSLPPSICEHHLMFPAAIRRLTTMAQAQSSPFSKAVATAMRKLYPEHLADKSFDNTGLLLEAPYNEASKLENRVLLTIDLTKAVTEEAIQRKCGVIVAYRA